jgi:hypothetical protein
MQFKHSWLAETSGRGLILLDDHPLEGISYVPSTFDVVVVINGLDHVYDFDLCISNAVDLVRPGSYFALGQHQSNEDEAPRLRTRSSDSRDSRRRGGLNVREFDLLLEKNLGREEDRNPHHHSSTLIFGRRKRMTRPVDRRERAGRSRG